jgi:hypothetical protein
MKYEALEPFSRDRSDYQAAVIASTTANTAGGKKDGGQFSPREFLETYFDFRRTEVDEVKTMDLDAYTDFKKQLIAAYAPSK